MSLRSGCGLQAELAHFVSAAIMDFTVSSSGDPQRDSCAKMGEANPPRNSERDAAMIDMNFIGLTSCRVVFQQHRRPSLFFAPDQSGTLDYTRRPRREDCPP